MGVFNRGLYAIGLKIVVGIGVSVLALLTPVIIHLAVRWGG